MAVNRVVDQRGCEWVVRRKWVHQRVRWRGSGRSVDLMDGADLLSDGAEVPVVGVIFLGVGLVLLVIAAALFIVPALVFIGELLVIAAIVGLGLIGRVLFRQPWTVEARQQGADHAYEWKSRGWRASGDLVQTVGEQLRSTGLPTGGKQTPPDAT